MPNRYFFRGNIRDEDVRLCLLRIQCRSQPRCPKLSSMAWRCPAEVSGPPCFTFGVIKLLRDTGMLTSIRRIGAVSGGSILAAHLVLNWDRYTGDEAAFESAGKEIIDFCHSDVRGNVARGWILAWLLIIPRLLKRKHWTFTNLLLQTTIRSSSRTLPLATCDRAPVSTARRFFLLHEPEHWFQLLLRAFRFHVARLARR